MVDFHETYVSVVKSTSVRAALAIAAYLDLELHEKDVVTAFLHGDLDKDIYIKVAQGEGCEKGNDVACEFDRALHGLKAAPRQCNKKIDELFVDEVGIEKCDGDPCLHWKWDRTSTSLMIFSLYVWTIG